MDNNNNTKETQSFTKRIYSHLLGEEHTPTHRKIAGVCVIIFGVGFVKIMYISAFEVVHFVGDAIGYLIHGIGCLPFVEKIMQNGKKNNDDQKPETGNYSFIPLSF